jgi:hypothetical protein
MGNKKTAETLFGRIPYGEDILKLGPPYEYVVDRKEFTQLCVFTIDLALN